MAYMKSRGHMHWGPGTSMTLFQRPAFGMGACCDSCAHGGKCSGGLGLFESGMDFTLWSWQEWGLVLLGGYMLMSTVSTTRRAVGRVRQLPGDARGYVKRGRKRLARRIAGE